jgi:hypothetical protein
VKKLAEGSWIRQKNHKNNIKGKEKMERKNARRQHFLHHLMSMRAKSKPQS